MAAVVKRIKGGMPARSDEQIRNHMKTMVTQMVRDPAHARIEVEGDRCVRTTLTDLSARLPPPYILHKHAHKDAHTYSLTTHSQYPWACACIECVDLLRHRYVAVKAQSVSYDFFTLMQQLSGREVR